MQKLSAGKLHSDDPSSAFARIALFNTATDRRSALFQFGECPLRVIRVAPTGSKASPNVRYASNSDRISASQRIDAMGHEPT
jgi:hypothetical protein